MSEQEYKELGKTLWAIADKLRGTMDADDFRDYMLSFLFLRYLSDNYEAAAKKGLMQQLFPVMDEGRKD
ncbi:MAG: type I restriction-modification system subunit M N-terminal domain-containing protein [Campylobacterales bacterium]